MEQTKFVINQEVFSTQYGWGRVIQLDNDRYTYPVVVEFEKGIARYTLDGRQVVNGFISLFNEEMGKLLELVLNYNPAPIKIGDEDYDLNQQVFGEVFTRKGHDIFIIGLEKDHRTKQTYAVNGRVYPNRGHYLLSEHAGKIVQMLQEIQKTQGYEISKPEPLFKVGDWVTITKSDKNWVSGMDKYNNKTIKIEKVYHIVVNCKGDTHTAIRFKNDDYWTFSYEEGHFRKAEQWEIPCC